MSTLWDIPEFWKQYGQANYYRERLESIIDLIPSGVSSVLDVGSGRSEILNELPSNWQTVGMDISRLALDYCNRSCVQGSAAHLPFAAKSFDLVICLEVLEHLSNSFFSNAVNEVQRVASTWLIIGLPINEDINVRDTCCVHCGYIFNADGHIRDFESDQAIRDLFPNFSLTMQLAIGPIQRRIPSPFLKLGQRFLNAYLPWEPFFVCPNCNYHGPRNTSFQARLNHLTYRLMRGSSLLTRGRPYWFMGLFKRR